MNGQLRRFEQLSGWAGVGWPVPHVGRPFPQPLSPNPGKAERSPSHPSRWVGRVSTAQGGGQWMPLGPPSAARPCQSRMFCLQNPLGTLTHSERSRWAPGPSATRAGPRGGGDTLRGLPGGGGDQDFALCLSLQSHQQKPDPISEARQPERGRLPLRGPLVNPDPTSLWSGL